MYANAPAAWMEKWRIVATLANPPQGNGLTHNMFCLKYYAIDMAYGNLPDHKESKKTHQDKDLWNIAQTG
jgi:hypothetical protein